MKLYEAKVGTEVECVEDYDCIKVGERGEIINVDWDFEDEIPIAVRWDQSHPGKHDFDGLRKNEHGYFVPPEIIECVSYTTEINESEFFDILSAF